MLHAVVMYIGTLHGLEAVLLGGGVVVSVRCNGKVFYPWVVGRQRLEEMVEENALCLHVVCWPH